MKPSKSQGPDKIHSMIIKECKTVLLKPLKTIFEKFVYVCKIPGNWKLGSVTAIFKSGSKLKPEWECSGGAKVLGKLPVPGRPTYCRIVVGQGPTALTVGAGGGCLDIFSLVYHFSFLSAISLGDDPI